MDLIDRQAVIRGIVQTAAKKGLDVEAIAEVINALEHTPSAEPEIIRCKDCFYGYLYSGVYDGTTCSWVECKKPDGLNRDVSIDGYCSAAIRKPYQQNNH